VSAKVKAAANFATTTAATKKTIALLKKKIIRNVSVKPPAIDTLST